MMMQLHRNFQTIQLPATQRKTGKRQWKPSIQILEEEIILREKTDASQAARAIGFYPPESGRDSNGRPFNVDTLSMHFFVQQHRFLPSGSNMLFLNHNE
jgi:hypothetical protein